MDTITLSPAYNADYKSKAEVLAAWLANKDFIIETVGVPWSGKPMNMPNSDETVGPTTTAFHWIC